MLGDGFQSFIMTGYVSSVISYESLSGTAEMNTLRSIYILGETRMDRILLLERNITF